MGKRFAPLFVTLSIVIFVLAFALLAGRVLSIKRVNLDNAEAHYVDFSRKVASSYLAYGSFYSPVFAETVKQSLEKEKDLQGIIIYSENQGIEYLLSREAGYLTLLPEYYAYKGTPPDYTINKLTEHIFSSEVTIPGLKGIHLDCIYTVLSKTELFPLFRDSLIILGVFFVVVIIFLVTAAIQPRLSTEKANVTTKPSRQVNRVQPKPAAPATPSPEGKETNTKQQLFSPDTGLGWEELLEKRLSFELRRAASFDQDLIFALMQSPQFNRGGKLRGMVAKLLIDHFPFQDLLFEYGDSGFAAAVPNEDIDVGIKNLEEFLKKARSLQQGGNTKISIGLSSRNGRLMSGKRLIEEAHKALIRASKEKHTVIMAFKPDPVKYRDYLASKK